VAGTLPDEVMLARLRKEAATREQTLAALRAELEALEKSVDERFSVLTAKTRSLKKGQSSASIISASRVVTDEGFALAEEFTRLEATVESGTVFSQASIEELKRAVATTEYALAEWTRKVNARFNETEANITETLLSYATTAFAEAKKTEAISAAAADATAKVDIEALARATKDGYMHGHWMLQVNAGKKFAGMRLSADDTPDNWDDESAIEFVADSFKISTGSSFGDSVAPFVLSGSNLTLNSLLVVNGVDLATIAANAAQPPLNYIGEFSAAPSPGGYPVNSVYKNTTDGHTYIRTNISTWALFVEKGATGAAGADGTDGTNGTNGTNGAAGERGSKAFFASGSSWSDSTANSAITAAGLTKVLLDQVTISDGTSFAETRFWDGSTWATLAAVINGNLLVNGTIGASKIAVANLAAITANLGTVTAGTITSSATIDVGSGINRVQINTGGITVGDLTINGSASHNYITVGGTRGAILQGGNAAANLRLLPGLAAESGIYDTGSLKLGGITAWYESSGAIRSDANVRVGNFVNSDFNVHPGSNNEISAGEDSGSDGVYLAMRVNGRTVWVKFFNALP
jgi:hypothetical protein